MKNRLFTVPAALAILVFAGGAYGQGTESGNLSVIVVTGNADLRVAPDQAIVRTGIMRQAGNAQTAQDQTNAVANQILSAVTKLGVAASEIQTSRLTLSPVFGPRGLAANEAPRIAAYQASNVISIRLDDLAKIGPVIDAALQSGANELQGVQFGLRDELPSRQQALKEAVTEARKKAETIAEALNVHLGNVIEVSEGGVSVVSPQPRTMPMLFSAERSAPPPTPVSPGELEVHSNVTVRYRIAP